MRSIRAEEEGGGVRLCHQQEEPTPCRPSQGRRGSSPHRCPYNSIEDAAWHGTASASSAPTRHRVTPSYTNLTGKPPSTPRCRAQSRTRDAGASRTA